MKAVVYRQRQAAVMSERELQEQVVCVARHLGWLVYHTFDSRRSEPGFPDLVLVRGQKVLFRELKTGRGRVSEAQRLWLERLAVAGADVGVWRPEQWLDGTIQEVLQCRR